MSVTEQILDLSVKTANLIRDDRRAVHRRPGVGMQVQETASLVADSLERMGLDVTRNVGGAGVVALLRGAADGPFVGLRADMDALEIQEQTDLPYRSEIDGVMHACGHDAHTAMLLGAARILSRLGDRLSGGVKFVFQPAEECAPTGGAPAMIADGVLEDPPVEAMVALHVWPDLPTGKVGVKAGPIMGASDRVNLVIRGRSAHGSSPEKGVDAVVMAAQLITALQTVVSRGVSPLDSAVLTFGTINGGYRYNVLADQVRIDGTLRTLDPQVRDLVVERIKSLSIGVSRGMGGDVEVHYEMGYPVTVNHPGIASVARDSVVDLLGEEGLWEVDRPSLGGEDFSFFASKVPSAFLWLGCRPPGIPPEDFPPLHNPRFNLDEDCLPLGAAVLAKIAWDLLDCRRGGVSR
ncbi:M20 metallopeptidase family protein [Thermanaerovibrio acidaminovorans]|uniref:M20 metallopeptidase family protein n=1 Tax=Thermanaerovibrio acidaminovorans TaxID=81462 RepID=UPI0024909FF7|nr:M20 family metallopeptidase [Thermanaerovibrio acidaminovorans]